MLAGCRPRVYWFLSATSNEDKSAMLVNLAASLTRVGSEVLLMDTCEGARGVASRLGADRGATLMQAARQERALDDVVQMMPQGFGVAILSRSAFGRSGAASSDQARRQARRLADTFGLLAARFDVAVVDAELGEDGDFPISSMSSGEIVIQVSTSPASIKSAYATIKRMQGQLGSRPLSLLVTGAGESEAKVVYRNMAQAAERYLMVKLNSMGSVPADEELKRATRLGRAVVDTFPLAGASVAFRRLAGKFALSDLPTTPIRALAGSSVEIGT